MKNKVIERVACYVRVSTREQSEHGYSIPEQTDRLRSYCKAMGWKVVKVYTDGGYSGATTDRPALTDLVEASQRHLIDAVVVYKLDRLSRSQKDTLTLIEGFLEHDVAFISMTESFDTSTPFGRATVGILSCFAQLERENIKERTSIGKEARAKEGKFHGGGFAPIGYDYKGGQLVVNEYEAMQVRLIHELYHQGESFRSIEKIMGERGLAHKNGAWYPNSVKRVLLNPLYTGRINYHHESVKGLHEAIISDKTYNETLAIFRQRTGQPKHMGQTLLGGMVYCARCGSNYTTQITRRTGDKVYRYYACNSRCKKNRRTVKDPNCRNDIWKAEELEGLVLSEVAKLKAEDVKPPKAEKKDGKLIGAELKKIDGQIARLVDLYAVKGISFDAIQKKMAELEERKKKLTATEEPRGFEKVLKSFDEAVKNGSEDQKRAVVRSLVDHIELDGEDVTIYWNF